MLLPLSWYTLNTDWQSSSKQHACLPRLELRHASRAPVTALHMRGLSSTMWHGKRGTAGALTHLAISTLLRGLCMLLNQRLQTRGARAVPSSLRITVVIIHPHFHHMHRSRRSIIGQAILTRLHKPRHLLTRTLDTTRHPLHHTPNIGHRLFTAPTLHHRGRTVQATITGRVTTRMPHHPHMPMATIALMIRTTAARRMPLHLTRATRMATMRSAFTSMSVLSRALSTGSDAAIFPRRQQTLSRPGSTTTAHSHTPPRTRRLSSAK
jgi:hypothetical protein